MGSVVAIAFILISLGISIIQTVRDDEKGVSPMTSCVTWVSNLSGNVAAGMVATLLLGGSSFLKIWSLYTVLRLSPYSRASWASEIPPPVGQRVGAARRFSE